jgi:hypothetical protein
MIFFRERRAEARAVLDGVLRGRIQFQPAAAARRYTLTIPIAYDRW